MRVDDIWSKQGSKRYKSVLIRQAYRDSSGKVKHHTYGNLTRCAPEEIEAVRLALKHKGNLSVLGSLKEVKTAQGLSVGAVTLLYQVAQRLGLVKVLGRSREGKLILWLVMARLIDQGSRLSAARLGRTHAVLEVLGMDPFCEDDLYAAMEWLDGHQEGIEKRLFLHRNQGSGSGLFLYDVTSSYLEGEENAYGAYGYNRDKKKGKKQIVVGLLTDAQGVPVSIQVYPGNTHDSATFEDQVEKARTLFGVRDVTMVGDRGMIKRGGIDALKKHGFHYITAITKAQIGALVNKGVLQLSLFDEEVCEVEEEGVRYILRRNPVRAKEINDNRSQREAAFMEFVAMKNAYLLEHPRAGISVALREVTLRGEKLKVKGWLKVEAEGRTLTIHKDDKALERIGMYDGCYVLKTDLPGTSAAKEVIHDRYKDLIMVEDAFRDMKTNHLEIRPVFVRNAKITRAHALIVMLAYRIRLELEQYWKTVDMTVEEALGILSGLYSVIMEHKDNRIQTVPEPNAAVRELLNLADVSLPPALPLRHKDVYTKKKLSNRRK